MSNFGNINGATILTVPANNIWTGTVMLSATATGAPGDASTAAHPTVSISGIGADNWADGDAVVAVALAVPPVAAGATVGSAASSSQVAPHVIIHARANPISLILNLAPRITGNALAAGQLIKGV